MGFALDRKYSRFALRPEWRTGLQLWLAAEDITGGIWPARFGNLVLRPPAGAATDKVYKSVIRDSVALRGEGGSNFASMYSPNGWFPKISTTSLTMFGWCWVIGATNNGIIISYGADGNSSGICLGLGSTTIDGSGGNVCALLGNIAHVNTGVSYGGEGLHHLGMTLGGGDNLRIYLDGAKIYSGGGGSAPSFGTFGSSPYDVTVLGPSVTGLTRFANAFIYDVKIWTYPFFDGQVATLYRSELAQFRTKRSVSIPFAPAPSAGYSYAIIL